MKKIISGVLACAAVLTTSITAFAANRETYNVKANLYPVPIEVKLPENNIDLSILTYGSQQLNVELGDINFGGNVYSKPLTVENYSECPIRVLETSSVKKSAGKNNKINLMFKADDDVNKDQKKNVKFFLSGSIVSPEDTRRDDGKFKENKGDIMIPKTASKTAQVLIPSIPAATSADEPGLGYFKINGDAAALPNPYWSSDDGAIITLILKITPA